MSIYSDLSNFFPEHAHYLEKDHAFEKMQEADQSGKIIVDLLENVLNTENWSTNIKVVQLAKSAIAQFLKVNDEYSQQSPGLKNIKFSDPEQIETQTIRFIALKEKFDLNQPQSVEAREHLNSPASSKPREPSVENQPAHSGKRQRVSEWKKAAAPVEEPPRSEKSQKTAEEKPDSVEKDKQASPQHFSRKRVSGWKQE